MATTTAPRIVARSVPPLTAEELLARWTELKDRICGYNAEDENARGATAGFRLIDGEATRPSKRRGKLSSYATPDGSPGRVGAALKVRQMAQYHETGSPSGYEEDHLIPLELGGSPSLPRNLWPEPHPRAFNVDAIENQLHRQVCAGTITLTAGARRRRSAPA